MYISHCHSKYSPDAKSELEEIIETAISRGVKVLTITDHCNCKFTPERNDFITICACVDEINALKERYSDKIKLLVGVEVAEEIFRWDDAKKIRNARNYDIILGSCHEYKKGDVFLRTASQEFETWSQKEIDEFVLFYYNTILEMIKKTDIDVVCHLTLPLRYLKRRGVEFDNTRFDYLIKEIYSLMIEKKLALELNTSGAKSGLFLPDEYYLRLYREMGGELITIGTDSHVADNVTQGFLEGVELLKSVGFTRYYYFENRKPIEVKIQI
ncbi:MAG: histidinol-phosphatase HisJ family protein [Clostridiales bacterium]|nr:histidinol-phosphatase HisJ family protein [Clostridiales bacterium]